MNLQKTLAACLARVIADKFPEAAGADPLITTAQNPRFGDYQANFAMALGKRLKRNPREIARQIADALPSADMLQQVEVAGPGFLNLRLSDDFLAAGLREMAGDERLGLPMAENPETIVVDYSSPNTCKPMHIGHVRSIVIGDAICRLLRLTGHKVIADNHLGDWGTQFGLLIAGYRRFADQVPDEGQHPLDRLVEIYKLANAAAEADEDFRNQARAELLKLHQGETENLQQWRQYNQWSIDHFNEIYRRMGTEFDEMLGESTYHNMLADVVGELVQLNLARRSEGALCIFWDDDSLPPMIVQKSDGAFLYATTDLATLKYRRQRWNPSRIIYLTDARQILHFRQLFSAAERWGVAGNALLQHVWFGSILGPDGTPLKTRSGELIGLQEVLDEAERRALAVVKEKNPDLSDDEMRQVAKVVGLGAIKYADLSQNRQSDILFDWDKMLAMQGNTAPYLQYAYARIRSIFRKGAEETGPLDESPIALTDPAERQLALKLLRFSEAVEAAGEDYRLNLICNYLFELSQAFAAFYEQCPVLKSESAVRAGRLQLCDLTARTLKMGLAILGIDVVERM